MNKIILALDVEPDKAIELVTQLDEYIDIYKIGYPLFVHDGDRICKLIEKKGKRIFFDFKFYDIPNTVRNSIKSLCVKFQPFMLTIHLSGGKEIIRTAVETVNELPTINQPLLLGVSVLTSLTEEDLISLGISNTIVQQVINLVNLGISQGIKGIVCSGAEIKPLRQVAGKELVIVVPGVQIDNMPRTDDQQRVISLAQAFTLGASYVVIGRPIYQSPNPYLVVEKMFVQYGTSLK